MLLMSVVYEHTGKEWDGGGLLSKYTLDIQHGIHIQSDFFCFIIFWMKLRHFLSLAM